MNRKFTLRATATHDMTDHDDSPCTVRPIAVLIVHIGLRSRQATDIHSLNDPSMQKL